LYPNTAGRKALISLSHGRPFLFHILDEDHVDGEVAARRDQKGRSVVLSRGA